MDNQFYIDQINRLRKERNAVILAHNYQRGEIQDIADYVGDSLGLSIIAAKTDAEVIVFCGVHFMAESAAILSPQKSVLLPDLDAGCPLADMATAETVLAKKQELLAEIQNLKSKIQNKSSELVIVSYVNTTAPVKAESDICCTSGNAVKVVNSISAEKTILFIPDKNLGSWVEEQTGRKMVLWEGYCPTHAYIKAEEVNKLQQQYPNAEFVCHPECVAEVRKLADAIRSTEGIIKYVKESKSSEFIIGTEKGILHRLQKENPEKKFYLASNKLICPNMKITTLKSVYFALEKMQNVITVPPRIQQRAKLALDKMIQIV
ncbi:MAG: quinolinate synthase NadA [bacterium]|nr:quinolinate synthase NadA [bacterium]